MQNSAKRNSPALASLTVTAAELFAEHVGATSAPAAVVESRALVVGGVAVATVGPDPSQITPLCATSAHGMPVVEVLAALAAQHPSGLLVLEGADGSCGFAFEVEGGRLTGARGAGPLDQLEPWVAEVHRRYPNRFDQAGEAGPHSPAWLDVAREFVQERVLDQLQLAREPGARMTFVRGDVEWIGTRIPADRGPSLDHLLLEHARRFDESPKIVKRLKALDKVAVPLTEPGPEPKATPPASNSGSADAWDFFDDPDPAAVAEWRDAVRIWGMCDGQSTLDEIVEHAMLGQFRALAALAMLVQRKHILLIEPEPEAPIGPSPGGGAAGTINKAPPKPDSVAPVIPLHAPELPPPMPVPARRRASQPDATESMTEYSFMRPPTKRPRKPRSRRKTEPMLSVPAAREEKTATPEDARPAKRPASRRAGLVIAIVMTAFGAGIFAAWAMQRGYSGTVTTASP